MVTLEGPMNSDEQPSIWNTISAMFLVAGTCIGGGMLALPIATGVNGFFPSIAVMTICWFTMTTSALLLLEASLWLKEGAHVISMSSKLLGPFAKWVAWITYLFICYASLVAYTAGGGLQISDLFQNYFNILVSNEMGCLLFVLLFGGVTYFGSQVIGRVNAILFVSMIAAFVLLIGMGSTEMKPSLLMHRKWGGAYIALPLLLTGFSFQTMVPSLTPILKRNPSALRLAVVGGTTLTFLIYTVWQAFILGIVPVGGEDGLFVALQKGLPATIFLREHVDSVWISQVAEFFAFFAMVTSFLGLSLGLYDFLSDGLNIKNKGFGHIKLAALVLIPTFICAAKYERAFLLALDSTGGFGDTVLSGFLPVLMVWVGRYKLGYQNSFRIPGGKPLLVVVGLFFVSGFVMEVLSYAGYLPSIFEAYDVLDVPDFERLIGDELIEAPSI